MLNWIKWLVLSAIALVCIAGIVAYSILRMSLPELTGDTTTTAVSAKVTLSRDAMGQAIITADNRVDAAYALGFAHAQDRLFQMDLQRRAASGELSEWVGSMAVDVDKRARFHQFGTRATDTFDQLPVYQKQLLEQYAKGVNAAIAEMSALPFEYLVTGFEPRAWQPSDSILVVYSMYMDLQLGQVDLDLARTALKDTFGMDMLRFLTQPSQYQAALDGSRVPIGRAEIPTLPDAIRQQSTAMVSRPPWDIGSNNWAVSGELTTGNGAMLANDMHLGLRVPIIWYRTQLRYYRDGENVSITGVSLPGLPGVVVGTNGHIAWGFTNANLDNVDWIRLPKDAPTQTINSPIALSDTQEPYSITMSEWGPVRSLNNQQYALQWVAHQPYAVNLRVMDLDLAKQVESAVEIAPTMGMPVQNMVAVDTAGNLAWTPAGAVSGRTLPSNTAITPDMVDEKWATSESDVPVVMNPPLGRLWTANARVIAANDLPRFGDGGYALGARAVQIRDRLLDRETFSEQDFYRIQLDNEARFLMPWHRLLLTTIQANRGEFAKDISLLENWGACACPDSVGYTLVRRFRSQVMQDLLSPVLSVLEKQGTPVGPLLRGVEPALWQLLRQQPDSWLPNSATTWQHFMLQAYQNAKPRILEEESPDNTLENATWGNVNALRIRHPFSGQIPLLGDMLNMNVTAGFGDSYMPAVQAPAFGASERFFVRPGALDKAILTLPGGQSGHPLSPYYRAGFEEYTAGQSTPLLPGDAQYIRTFSPKENQ
ncbi:penicillin acylase family protein [Alteromonas sp. H39]|uniref:penicillin acylase family protein n=1 Tax=Alteromonas sp. H39 TaxID=3389876 RepID=UPI0039E00DF8